MRKTYEEKLHTVGKGLPTIETIGDPGAAVRMGILPGETMLVTIPVNYDRVMKLVPYGKVITTDELREFLAAEAGADTTCPLTTGIFINIVAHASQEREGRDETCWWRTLKKNGELNPKYPGAPDLQRSLLESEGHVIVEKGIRLFVDNYRERLFNIS
ncbi:MAG: MGMT family protein [Propionibacteriaceae bacterium]|nr:MGMT family protein [Propionibacteriaceae bacterium]